MCETVEKAATEKEMTTMESVKEAEQRAEKKEEKTVKEVIYLREPEKDPEEVFFEKLTKTILIVESIGGGLLFLTAILITIALFKINTYLQFMALRGY